MNGKAPEAFFESRWPTWSWRFGPLVIRNFTWDRRESVC